MNWQKKEHSENKNLLENKINFCLSEKNNLFYFLINFCLSENKLLENKNLFNKQKFI
jgi:hypothetical protein